MPTVEELYQNVLGRAPESEWVVADWQSRFGDTIDKQDIDAFVAAAQAEKPGATINVSDQAIRDYVTQNFDDPQAIANAANLYGVSSADIQRATGYTPTSQSEYFQQSSVSPLQQLTVEQLYKDVLNRDPVSTGDVAGLQYWKGQFGETIEPEEIARFKQEAAPELVRKAYTDVLGRPADVSGEQHYIEKIRSGEIKPETLAEVLAKGATSVEDRIRAQTFLGSNYFAPSEFLQRTGGLSYQEMIDYVSRNISDPTKVYQAAQQFNVNPNDLVSAMQTNKIGQLETLSDVQNFFQQGQAGFSTRFDQILDETFGNDQEKARIEQILGMKAGDLDKIYNPSQFSRSSIEKIEESLQSSRVNKIQDALITKAIAKDLLGYTDAEMKSVVSDLAQGKEDDPFLKEIYNSLKSGNKMTKDEFEDIMTRVAQENPDSAVLERNPDLKLRYEPIKPEEGVSGQYGYHNNAPILYMPAFDRYLLDSNQSKIDLAEGDLGWATNSKYLGEVRNGAAVFGVKATPQDIKFFDEGEKKIPEGGLQTRVINDPEVGPIETLGAYVTQYDENGAPYQRFVSASELFGYDETTGLDRGQQYKETRQQLESAAQKLNINPKEYASTKELFDAVQDKSKDLYLVVGRATQWDPDVAKASGITKTDGSRGGVNHAAVLYQRVGDKGIPLQSPQTFNFDDPKTLSFAQELASLPFVAELALLNPATAAYYPYIKAAQGAIMGQDIGDIAKSVALSYIGQNVLPQIAPDITASIGNTLLEAGVSPEIAGTLADAGARVALNTGMSVLAGAELGEAAERSLVNFAVNKGVSGGLSLADFPKEFQPDVARILTEGIVTGQFDNAAKTAIMRYGGSQLKNIVGNVNTPISSGPALSAARGGLAQARKIQKMPRRVAPIRRDVRKLIPLRKSGLSYA